jgi:hypothetical protein
MLQDIVHPKEMIVIGMCLKDYRKMFDSLLLYEVEKAITHTALFWQVAVDQHPAIIWQPDKQRVAVPARKKIEFNMPRLRTRLAR